MDATRRSLALKTFALVAAACAIEYFVLQSASDLMRPGAIDADSRLAHTEGPAATPNGRRCDALDSFGNPIRPCRT